MKRIYTFLSFLCIAGFAFAQPAITGVIVPQYMADTAKNGSSTEGPRTPLIFRAKITGLTAGATYRYATRATTYTDATCGFNNGAGNPIYCRQGGYFTTSTVDFTTLGRYDSLVASSTGEYEGWFGIEPTGNTRFAAGKYIRPRIILNNGTGGTAAANCVTVTDSILCVGYGVGASNASGLYSRSAAADRNVAVIYDNVSGTGRPISCAIIENDGIAYRSATTPTNYPLFYRNNVDTISGAWGTLIPNTLANGVRRIENRNFSDGSLFYANTDADGVWTTGSVSTVNPSAGIAGIKIDSIDAPLVPPSSRFNFVQTSYSVNENVDSVIVRVKYTNPGATNTSVTVSLGVTSTATSGTDFTSTTPAVLTFAPADTEKTVKILVIDDALTESNETIILRLGSATNGATLTNDSATITVVDNDGVIASLASSAQSINEGAGTATITVKLSKKATLAGSVNIAAANASAGAADYAFSNTTVNFAVGDSVKTVTATITDDALVEGNEYFLVSLSNAVNLSLGTAVDTVTIIDNDFPRYPIGQISTVNATTGVADSLGKKYDEVGVVYGINYRPAGLQFVIRDNTGGITVFKATGNHGYTVTEGDSVRVIGTVAQFNGLTEFNSDTVFLLGTGKTIRAPRVITKLTEADENDLVRINKVQFVTPIATWPTAAANISVRNATDTMVIRLQLANADILGKPAPAGLFDIIGIGSQFDGSNPYTSGYQLFPRKLSDIIPAPPATVNVSPATISINENGGSAKVKLTITNANAVAATVALATTGTATSGTDYTAPAASYTFPATAVDGDSIIVSFPITDDALTESNETIIATFTSSANCNMGANNVSTITITDNDAVTTKPVITVDTTAISVNENVGTVKVKVKISGVNGTAATASITFSGTATSTTDYTAPAATITFPASAANGDSVMLTYTIIDDATSENDETIISTFTAGSNSTVVGSSQTITILKNDGTGIPQTASSKEVRLYPNPSSGSIQVTSTVNIESVHVMDITGKSILELTPYSTETSITGLTAGIYVVTVTTANGVSTQKAIVK